MNLAGVHNNYRCYSTLVIYLFSYLFGFYNVAFNTVQVISLLVALQRKPVHTVGQSSVL